MEGFVEIHHQLEFYQVGWNGSHERTYSKNLRSELKDAQKKCCAPKVPLSQFMDRIFGSNVKFTNEEHAAACKRIHSLVRKETEANDKLKALQDQIESEEVEKVLHELKISQEETACEAARSVAVSNALDAEFL